MSVAARDDLHRIGEQLELHTLFFGLRDFFRQGRHFDAAAAIDDGDFLGAHAQGRACGVHGHVASADHDGLLAEGNLLAQIHRTKKIEAVHHASGIVARQAHLLALVRARADEDGGVAGFLQAIDGDVLAQLLPELHLDAFVEDLRNLVVEHVARQTVRGHAQTKHAAQEWARLEECHAVALRG